MNQHFATLGASPDLKITPAPNGLTVVTEAMPGLATATLGVWVGAGSRNERPEEHGLSHLIEHMAFKGTATRSARRIAEDIENVGGEINAATSVEQTSYTARVLGEDAEVALDVLGDILTRSVFEAGELAREKGVILQEYAAVEDTPDDVVYDAFTEAAFPDQPIGRPILGRPETIKSFDKAAIEAYLAREYTPGRMVLAAAGAVEHDAIVAAAREAFRIDAGRRGAGGGGGPLSRRRAADAAQARTGQPGARPAGPVVPGRQLLRHASLRAGARRRADLAALARGARDPGAGLRDPRLPLAVQRLRPVRHRRRHLGQRPAGLVEVTLGCLREAADTVDTAELARAKAQLKVALLSALETPGGRIERTARQLLAWGRVIPAAEVIAKVDAVTPTTCGRPAAR